jgi:hypothetical protein
MAVKNLQSVVRNVATQRGNVTNPDSKGYGMAMQQPAMSSPQYPALSEPARPGLRHERGARCSTNQAAKLTGSLASWAGNSGSRGTFLTTRSEATGNHGFPRRIRTLAMSGAFSATRDCQDFDSQRIDFAGSSMA